MGVIDDLQARVLRTVQFVGARVANRNHEPCALPSAHDLLKARYIASYLRPGDRVLDVGSGNGARVRDLSMFVPDLDGHAIDIGRISAPRPLPFTRQPSVSTYDGEVIPHDDDSFDVVMVCYVLHHLKSAHCEQLLREMVRVARRRVILLEDSVPTPTLMYRLRNWAHIAESNLEYRERAASFEPVDSSGFRTHSEWIATLSAFDGIADVDCVPLGDISQYRHHTLLVADCG